MLSTSRARTLASFTFLPPRLTADVRLKGKLRKRRIANRDYKHDNTQASHHGSEARRKWPLCEATIRNIRTHGQIMNDGKDKLSLLEAMIDRPAMYFGPRAGYLREFAAFDFGYSYAHGWDELKIDFKNPFIPHTFVDFVCSRIPVTGDISPNWVSRIESVSTSEEGAWSVFLDLWRQFRSFDRETATI